MSLPSLAPVRCWYRRIATRAEPLRLFEALYSSERHAFLYESLESTGQQGRYSFIGAKPRAVFVVRGDELELLAGGALHRAHGDPLDALRSLLQLQQDAPPVAPFCGGAVGYLSYDAVRWCERIPAANPDDLGAPDAQFLFPQEVLCFDHLEKVLHVLLYQDAGHEQRFGEIRAALQSTAHHMHAGAAPEAAGPTSAGTLEHAGARGHADSIETPGSVVELRANMTQAQFEQMVLRAKEYILAGDVFQVVLSQRFEFDLAADPLAVYRALRRTNPSPYMYYLRLDDLHVAGSSPEVLATLTGRRVVTRPLAGTRRRGRTPAEDVALAAELAADPKERAEHVMLVDLGRNDLGRVCDYGEVQVRELLQIERHSKVMHLVSTVEGWLREGADAIDVFRATFPAGTVSGAPKVRAMEIIEELEPVKRGVYAGAIGYFSLLGDMDLCIAIRTIVVKDGKGYIQAGAGIVADSIPALEYKETLNKAAALMNAARAASRPFEPQP